MTADWSVVVIFMAAIEVVSLITATVPPTIIAAPPPIVYVHPIDSAVQMKCAARGSPPPTVEWFKDGKPLSLNQVQKGKEMHSQLVFEKFQPSDQGTYKCFFRNYENGTAETITKVGKENIYLGHEENLVLYCTTPNFLSLCNKSQI